MKFGQSAELVGNQLIDLPVRRKQIVVPFLGFLARALEPGKSPLRVIESSVWLSRGEQFLVGIQNELAVPTPQVVERLSADRIHN